MWITKTVELPDTLVDAQQNGNLVVFAGAGVSMDPPSNYPDFQQLVSRVAEGSQREQRDREPIDVFLGRLEDQGVDVHRRAFDILTNPESRPNKLHFDLIRLFSSAAELRLVTTNFDSHFTTAAQQLFQEDQEKIEIFYAPALPLGDQFNGIVYLHGSVEKGPETLILTDRDFGKAYLRYRWAARFLREMFSSYLTLFVGYSHNDPIMNYLARALPPRSAERYVLTTPDKEDHWRPLGINAITFPLSEGADKYLELKETIEAWKRLATMGTFDHEHKIREIVQSAGPVAPDTDDYLKHVLQNATTARFFTKHAKSHEWLRWVEDQEHFRSLFDPALQMDEDTIAHELAMWFAENFAFEYPDESLDLVRRSGQVLNPILSRALIRQLSRQEPSPDPEVMSKWLTVILPTPWARAGSRSLDLLLRHCRFPDHKIATLLLFEYLTTPQSRLTPGFGSPPRVEVFLTGDEYLLRKAWKETLRPNLAFFAPRLEPFMTAHLVRAHYLLQAAGVANDRWDPVSFSRSAVEPHKQDKYRRDIDVLIDAARDILSWVARQHPGQAQAVIGAYIESDVPILRRLALHGLTECSGIEPDGKIAWILDRKLLYSPGLKHELFRLLKTTYPSASTDSRERLLDNVKLGRQGEGESHITEEVRQYEVYNLLYWLHQADPDCPLAIKQFTEMQQTHPDFSPRREYPDLDSWTGEVRWVGTESSVSVKELLDKDPKSDIDWFLEGHGEVLATTSEAVRESFQWGWQLTTVLVDREEWSSDLWRSLIQGWRETTLSNREWDKVLTMLTNHSELHAFSDSISELLEDGIKKEKGRIPNNSLTLAEKLARHVWKSIAADTKDKGVPENLDWLAAAINHPGGRLLMFWFYLLSLKKSEAADSWHELPGEYKDLFESILVGQSYTDQLGRVVLASQIHFLYSLDQTWAIQSILPLLDWSIDEKRAEQAWNGFLIWGRWNRALLPDILPLYEQAFPRLSSELLPQRGRFTEHLADIAIYGSLNPVENGWLMRFILAAEPEDREKWASHVRFRLSSMDQTATQSLWDQWIKDYWTNRVSGAPVRLLPEEVGEMIGWAIELGEAFPEAVEKISEGPKPHLDDVLFYYDEIIKKNLATLYPTPTARLLHQMLIGTGEPFYHCKEVGELVTILTKNSASQEVLLAVCEEAARLGCRNASELRDMVAGTCGG